MNLAYALERNAAIKPDEPAILFKNHSYTYKQINQETNRYANLFEKYGIKKGDCISIWLPNGMEFIYAFYAILKIGALAVPINYLFKKAEALYILKNSDAKLLVTDNGKLEFAFEMLEELQKLEKIAVNEDLFSDNANLISLKKELKVASNHKIACELSPDHGACVLYTSGTTGQPKGVELSHFNVSLNAEFYADSIGLTDRHYGCIVTPLSHLLVLMAGLILIFMKGGKFYLFERFNAQEVASKIHQEKINFFIGVPAMYYMFLTLPEEEKYDMSSLQICITSGAHMPLEVRRKFEERFQTFTIQAYGQTESSPVITVDQISKERRFESVGLPLPHIEVKIVDEKGNEQPPGKPGEIIARGHCVMKGYWKNEEATKNTVKNGWLYTGDIGKMDEDGYVYLLDRLKEMIISGGYNIYPKELENVLYQHPAVLEAAVIGIEDERLGEIPKAFIVLKEDSTVTTKEIKKFSESQLASYKRIREVEFVEEIPKTPTGKLMKRRLVEQENAKLK
ncbi:hypothetical protein DCC39_03845 [Pueribacillus theae]|uniref:Long-chain fatty acid--CoA ligase n=1 Tax=Pueribacillus theae TaxID=2171751 RepID=A0A2U1K5J9_9BACI|nr:long-chain-fatty-acid--CoA ligase [Pueribacillus theae]PWA12790.1 hypothetical protein DCC39_03845 [Pueribacillus theae]